MPVPFVVPRRANDPVVVDGARLPAGDAVLAIGELVDADRVVAVDLPVESADDSGVPSRTVVPREAASPETSLEDLPPPSAGPAAMADGAGSTAPAVEVTAGNGNAAGDAASASTGTAFGGGSASSTGGTGGIGALMQGLSTALTLPAGTPEYVTRLGALAGGQAESALASSVSIGGGSGGGGGSGANAAPVLAAPTIVSSSDDQDDSSSILVAHGTPSIRGVAPASSTVSLFTVALDGVRTLIGTGVATADGAFEIMPTAPLADGAYSVVASATRGSTISGTSAPVSLTIDTATARPTIDLATVSDTFGAGTGGTDGDHLTADRVVTVGGKAEAGARVVVTDGALTLADMVATAGETWQLNVTLGEGRHDLVATAVDRAGNTAASDARTVTVDTSAAPIAPRLLDDTGASAADGITASATPRFAGGGAEPSALVVVYANRLSIGQAQADASGAWSLTGEALVDGSYLVTARQVDAAGNTSAVGAGITVVVDTRVDAPGGVTLLDDSAGAATSGTASDRLTDQPLPRVAGTAEAGAAIELREGGVSVGSATADATTGAWTIITVSLADGVHSLSAVAVDLAGNASVASSPLVVTVDTAAPVAAPLTMANGSDSAGAGTAGTASDRVTRVVEPVVHGTGEAGSAITVYEDVAGVLTSLGDTSVGSGGNWSAQLAALGGSATGVSHTLVTVETDRAGNTSAPSAALVVVVDTAALTPSLPMLRAADDTDTAGDGVTTVARPHFSGTAEGGSRVTLLDNGVNVGVALADGSGAWTIQANPLAVGAHLLTAVAVDMAGNESAAGPAFALTVGLPLTQPSAPALLGADDSAPIGSTNTDRITRLTTPRFAGNTGSGFAVTLLADGVSVGDGVADLDGNFTIASGSLSSGSHQISLRVTDPVTGGTSGASQTLQVVVDQTPPAIPTANLAPGYDSSNGASPAQASDHVTQFVAPTLSGTAEVNAVVRVMEGAATLGVASANGSGAWTLALVGVSLADGTHSLAVTAFDAADNASAPTTLAVVVDTQSAAPVTAPVLSAASDTGVSAADGITATTRPRFTGVAPEGGSVVVLLANGVSVGQAVADAATGAYTIDVAAASALGSGVYAMTVRATDPAGNASAASPASSLVIDTGSVAPSGLQLVDDSYGEGTSGTDTDRLTRDAAVQIGGTAEAGAVVTLLDGGVSVGQALADAGSGAWTVTSVSLADGSHSLTAVAVDKAGNTSAASGRLTVVVDSATAAPTLALAALQDTAGAGTAGTTSDGITSRSSQIVAGTGEAGAWVVVSDAGTSLAEAVVGATGHWQVTLGLVNGTHTLGASVTDKAGNTDTGGPLVVVVDTVLASLAPVLLDDTGTAGDLITSASRPQLGVITAEAGVALTLLDGDTSIGSVLATTAGAWTLVAGSLGDGVHSLAVRQVDIAGNSVTSAPLVVTIDSGIAAPTLALAPGQDTAGAGTITRSTTLGFTGAGAEVGGLATLYNVTGGVTTSVGSAAVGAGGSFTFANVTASTACSAVTAPTC